MTAKKQIALASSILVTGVILGAFGAHGLKEKISADALMSYKTGVLYQLLHGLGMLLIIIIGALFHIKTHWIIRLQVFGVLLFSGSIYLLSCKSIFHLDNFTSILGPLTPIGGLLLILSWVILLINSLKS